MAWQGMLRYGNGRPLGGLAVGCMAQMGRWSPDISQSTISMSALGNTSHTTQTRNPKHCKILIEGILFKGAISQLYRNKFQNVFSPMRQISKQALQQVGFFFKLSSLSLSSRNSSNTLQLY